MSISIVAVLNCFLSVIFLFILTKLLEILNDIPVCLFVCLSKTAMNQFIISCDQRGAFEKNKNKSRKSEIKMNVHMHYRNTSYTLNISLQNLFK